MKSRIYVRVAKHHRFRRGQRVETSMTYNPNALTVGGSTYDETPVHTVFFALDFDTPDELLKPASVPTVDIGPIDVELATTVTPEVEVVEEETVGAG